MWARDDAPVADRWGEQKCGAALADSWGYGQECSRRLDHMSSRDPNERLHRYERGDGFVIMWGYER